MIDFIAEKFFKTEKVKNELMFTRLKEIASKSKNDTEQFIRSISLGTAVDEWKPNIEAVNLMTLHASKGLEFNCVFIAGCEDGLMPYSLNQTSNTEEEQRLLYVGMTRAKNYLFLTHAKKRFLMGKEYQFKRSPFLDKIETELIEAQKQEYKHKEKKKDDQLKMF
jgi:superfamily I DNA/RNA helicase